MSLLEMSMLASTWQSHGVRKFVRTVSASSSEVASVTEALRRAGVADYIRAETRITAERANPTQALHLGLREGDPLLRTTALNTATDGTPVEYGRTWFAGDRVTLTVTSD